jgi:hypothetical protein
VCAPISSLGWEQGAERQNDAHSCSRVLLLAPPRLGAQLGAAQPGLRRRRGPSGRGGPGWVGGRHRSRLPRGRVPRPLRGVAPSPPGPPPRGQRRLDPSAGRKVAAPRELVRRRRRPAAWEGLGLLLATAIWEEPRGCSWRWRRRSRRDGQAQNSLGRAAAGARAAASEPGLSASAKRGGGAASSAAQRRRRHRRARPRGGESGEGAGGRAPPGLAGLWLRQSAGADAGGGSAALGYQPAGRGAPGARPSGRCAPGQPLHLPGPAAVPRAPSPRRLSGPQPDRTQPSARGRAFPRPARSVPQREDRAVERTRPGWTAVSWS